MKVVGRVSDWMLRRVAPQATAEASTPPCVNYCLRTYYYTCFRDTQEGICFCVNLNNARCV